MVATVIIGTLLVIAILFSIKSCIRNFKSGSCAGCSGCHTGTCCCSEEAAHEAGKK